MVFYLCVEVDMSIWCGVDNKWFEKEKKMIVLEIIEFILIKDVVI